MKAKEDEVNFKKIYIYIHINGVLDNKCERLLTEAVPLVLGSLSFHRLLNDGLSGEVQSTLTPFDAVGQLDLL